MNHFDNLAGGMGCVYELFFAVVIGAAHHDRVVEEVFGAVERDKAYLGTGRDGVSAVRSSMD
jgi:hypothetical protein